MSHDVTAHAVCKYGEWPLFVVFSRLQPCFNLENKKLDTVLGVLTQKIRPTRNSEAKTVYCSDFKEIRKFFKERKVRASCGCVSPDKQEPAFHFFRLSFEFKLAVGRFLLFDLNCVNVKLWAVLCRNIVLLAKINSDIVDCIISDPYSPMLDAVNLIVAK